MCGCSVSGLLIASRTVLKESEIVVCSGTFIIIRSENFVLTCFRALLTMESGH